MGRRPLRRPTSTLCCRRLCLFSHSAPSASDAWPSLPQSRVFFFSLLTADEPILVVRPDQGPDSVVSLHLGSPVQVGGGGGGSLGAGRRGASAMAMAFANGHVQMYVLAGKYRCVL